MWVALLGLPLAARKLGHHASHLWLLCNKPDLLPALSHNPARSLSDRRGVPSILINTVFLYIVHSGITGRFIPTWREASEETS